MGLIWDDNPYYSGKPCRDMEWARTVRVRSVLGCWANRELGGISTVERPCPVRAGRVSLRLSELCVVDHPLKVHNDCRLVSHHPSVVAGGEQGHITRPTIELASVGYSCSSYVSTNSWGSTPPERASTARSAEFDNGPKRRTADAPRGPAPPRLPDRRTRIGMPPCSRPDR
jgi:hypothetical protein